MLRIRQFQNSDKPRLKIFEINGHFGLLTFHTALAGPVLKPAGRIVPSDMTERRGASQTPLLFLITDFITNVCGIASARGESTDGCGGGEKWTLPYGAQAANFPVAASVWTALAYSRAKLLAENRKADRADSDSF